MSYYKIKNITLKKKENKIMVCGASNNVSPITYYNNDFMQKEKDFHKKELELLRAINGGDFVLNESCYKWLYAKEKANTELYGNKNSWQFYEDTSVMRDLKIYVIGEKISDRYIPITQEDLDNGDFIEDFKSENYTLYINKKEKEERENKVKVILEEYYNVFMKYFNEKHKGKYYLYSEKYGYIKAKSNSGSFYYSKNAFYNNELDYFKAYCLANKIGKDIEIREIPKRTYIPTKEQKEESIKRLELLGLENYKYKLTISERYNVVGLNDNNYDLKEKINDFENEHNCYVYHIIHSHTNIGELYSMFYVSNDKEEWEEDRKMLKAKETYSYVYNKSDHLCSEIGLIGFKIREDKVLERTF